jgi:ubiquinone/menaquinone biosynthesis C-methylase UbiE
MTSKDYVLGTQADELARLEFQHKVWIQQAYALFQRAGFREGQVVLDLGCGPGFTSMELAHVVGPKGRVIARDQSASFLQFLAAERTRRGLLQIELSEGPVETLALAEASLDAIYSRWLFCGLADPGAVLLRVAKFLRPGGVIALQEYLDWAAMKHVPRDPRFDSLVATAMRSWSDAKARIDIALEIPTLAERAGLEVVYFQPIPRAGRPGSLEWRWIESFFETYAPKMLERGLLTAQQLEDWLPAVRSRGADDPRHCVTPMMADVVLRKR